MSLYRVATGYDCRGRLRRRSNMLERASIALLQRGTSVEDHFDRAPRSARGCTSRTIVVRTHQRVILAGALPRSYSFRTPRTGGEPRNGFKLLSILKSVGHLQTDP
jgi:hypothetical protein